MNRATLRAFVRTISDPSATDAEVLDRYRTHRDSTAFTSLVDRYGRLVWSVCRHLTRTEADAEDAFQATFLVLSLKAGAIRKTDSLGAWLYGVASRVCSKSRRTTERRRTRERANGKPESSSPVPDSVWDRALTAVHEEVAKLPESLRVPFVMCCLEGKGPVAAADQLGWKLGTLSGRLTRAKDLLIARLDARGLTAGAVATATLGIGVSNAPASAVERAVAVASDGYSIPGSILHLSQGVFGMGIHRAKLLAAAILLAGGLGSGVGTMWQANATAQPPASTEKLPPPAKQVVDPNEELAARRLSQAAELLAHAVKQTEAKPPDPKWEYRLDRKPVGYAPTVERFKQTLSATESDGWEFVGQTNTAGDTPDQPILPTLVFRRKFPLDRVISGHHMQFDKASCISCHAVSPNGTTTTAERLVLDLAKTNPAPQDYRASFTSAVEKLDQKNAKIAELEAQIAALKANAKNDETKLTIAQRDLPLGVHDMQDILVRIAPKIGMKGLKIGVNQSDGGTLDLAGTMEQVEWARRLIQTLSGKADPKGGTVKP